MSSGFVPSPVFRLEVPCPQCRPPGIARAAVQIMAGKRYGFTGDFLGGTFEMAIQRGNSLAPITLFLNINSSANTFTGSFLPTGLLTPSRKSFRGVIFSKSQLSFGQFKDSTNYGAELLNAA